MTDASAVIGPAAPTPSSASSAGDDAVYVVRWHEGQKLYRVWNSVSNCWAPRPGFSDERVARAVADSLASPQVPRARSGR